MTDFSDLDARVSQLRKQISATETQLASLHQELAQAEARAHASRDLEIAYQGGLPLAWQQETLDVFAHISPDKFTPLQQHDSASSTTRQWPLEPDEYRRYGRQMIMPEVGLRGQLALKSAKVLVVGVGGLGCPAAAYLAGAGVGTLGLVDGDTVETSNLHRQIGHSTSRVGQTKVRSAINYLRDLNPHVQFKSHEAHLDPSTAYDLVSQYDVVLDCTDHPTSRYLISDACVLACRPLVSASALKMDGQLIVLNNPPAPQGDVSGGPCYRCIWPTPPPPEAITTCGEGGILGPVVGTMGVLQALETIKLIVRSVSGTTQSPTVPPRPHLLMFSATSATPFRSARMRGRRPACAACGTEPSVNRDRLQDGSLDYVAFCGGSAPVEPLPDTSRIQPSELAHYLRSSSDASHQITDRPLILDVRPAPEFEICSFDGAVNLPWTELPGLVANASSEASNANGNDELSRTGNVLSSLFRKDADETRPVVVVCRLGNDSQLATRLLKEAGVLARDTNVVDLRGGLAAWRRDVDPSWPDY